MFKPIPSEHKIYFLLRELISNDKTNAFLKKTRVITEFSAVTENSVRKNLGATQTISEFFSKNPLLKTKSPNVHRKYNYTENFLKEVIQSPKDMLILYALLKHVIPISNRKADNLPGPQYLDEAKKAAQATLTSEGDKALPDLINNWDSRTYQECMCVENRLAMELYSEIDKSIQADPLITKKTIAYNACIAACREFERRAGQARKPRAGWDLHQAVALILDHIGQKYDPNPKLVTGTIEADLLITKGHWKYIISCKRTGRERVKQVSPDPTELATLRIKKIIWFFTEFDQTPDRVVDLGNRGAIFYLPDNSPQFKSLSKHHDAKKYIYGISTIRESLKTILAA